MVRILSGNCLNRLKQIPDQSVHCCITSPPYFGLRDYGHHEQIGSETKPDLYIRNLVLVFREVHRILRNDGTLWINIGDTYAGSGGAGNQFGQISNGLAKYKQKSRPKDYGLKPKDLIGIPWRLAFALQSDGWFLRQDIIWHKPNPMPEPVTDRCTKSHEYIFLFSKSESYFFDHESIKEASVNGETDDLKNKRSVWSVNVQPYSGAHFATFPPALIAPCVLAGSPPDGIVLDPFGGSGTTGLVAQQHDRQAILCELNSDYVQLAADRIRNDCPMFSEVRVESEFQPVG